MGNCIERGAARRSRQPSVLAQSDLAGQPAAAVIPSATPASSTSSTRRRRRRIGQRLSQAQEGASVQDNQSRLFPGANSSALQLILNEFDPLELHFMMNIGSNLQDDRALETAVLYTLQVIRTNG